MKYLLDTHVWVWWNMNPRKLSPRVRSLLSQPGRVDEILLSAISPWEFGKLLEKGRIGISCHPEEWIARALDMPGLRLVPLSPVIACRSSSLPPPFGTDPADQIIVATAREESAVILTRDQAIRKYPHVRSLW
ncbi:MAG: type II toxin-antitoxin system VapC family toxin [Candidatus Erginobacter occultus]|nr:type II toxin-antitoxin system VapC family toxin [Candidatus Erginobacter occultus]